MKSVYEELVELRSVLKPVDEFMCCTAEVYELHQAQAVVQASVRAAGEFCLQSHWETLKGYTCDQVPYTDPEYQTFRLQWLDKLIGEYK